MQNRAQKLNPTPQLRMVKQTTRFELDLEQNLKMAERLQFHIDETIREYLAFRKQAKKTIQNLSGLHQVCERTPEAVQAFDQFRWYGSDSICALRSMLLEASDYQKKNIINDDVLEQFSS